MRFQPTPLPKPLPPGGTAPPGVWRITSGSLEFFAVTPTRRIFIAAFATGSTICVPPGVFGGQMLILLAPDGASLDPAETAPGAFRAAVLTAMATLAPAAAPPACRADQGNAVTDAPFFEWIASTLADIAAAQATQDFQARQASHIQTETAAAEAAAGLAHILTERSPAPPLPPSDAEYALRQIIRLPKAPLIPPGAPPGAPPCADETLAGWLARRGLLVRPVTLSGTWWRHDRGGCLTTRLADGRAVALATDWRGRTRLYLRGAPPETVTAKIAGTLNPAALMPLVRLPAATSGLRGVVIFGLSLARRDVALLLACGVFSSLLALILPMATRLAVDVLVPAGGVGPLLLLGGALVLLTAAAALLHLCAHLGRLRLDGVLSASLQGGVLDRLMRLPLEKLRQIPSADLSARVQSVAQARRLISETALEALPTACFALTSLCLLFSYSVPGGLVALAAGALLITAAALTGLAQLRALSLGAAMTANLAAATLQIIQNISVLQVSGAESRAWTRWARNAAAMRGRMLRSRLAAIRFESLMAASDGLALAAALGALAMALPGRDLSTGTAMAFLAAFESFLLASEQLARGALQLISAQPSFARTGLVLNTPPEEAGAAADPGTLSGGLSFNSVRFGYTADRLVLDDISFSVAPGQLVAFTGASGCGKSTLLALALGFLKPASGTVMLDGRDLANLDPAAVRRQIGVVRQGGRLLAGSILDTLRGMHDCTLEDAWHAASLAGIADDIRRLPMGMHTLLTDGTPVFSGGQVQRLLLARALAGNPRILVLDEATSALDNPTQALITQNLAGLGMTRLVVAHRLSTVRDADMIHFLAGGRIVQSGRFEDLLREPGPFADFARRQLL